MTKFQNKLYQVVLFLGDTLFFVLSLYLAQALRNQEIFTTSEQMYRLVLTFSPIFAVVVISYFIATLYEVPPLFTSIARVKLIIQLHVIALVFGFSIFYLFPLLGLTPKVILLLQIVIFTLFQSFWRVYSSHHIKTQKKTRALLIGDGAEIAELKASINGNPHSSIIFVDHIEINSPLLTSGTLESLQIVLKENKITVLVVDVKSEKVIPLLPYFYNLVGDGLRIYDVHKMYEDTFRRMPLSAVGYFWFFENVSIDMRIYEILKRGMDITISLFVAVVWLLLHPIVAYLIQHEDGGSVFLNNQFRIGRHGKKIKLIKYRTMSNDDGGVWLKEKGNKNRVTKIGYYLRKSRIDELPQVLNVLRGEVSLIGPRPDIVDLGNKMAQEIPFYMIRYSVTPGLSGWAQTLQEKPPQSVEETRIRLMYDLFYIKNRSLLLDIVILLRTIRTLLMRSGM
jgi:lipopolysaccharide/colanic/teichoic acid biosynthesis glycosyltransferase